jgi:hypothetical protein
MAKCARIAVLSVLFLLAIVFLSCGGGPSSGGGGDPGGPPTGANYSGVLQWKGGSSGNGLYSNETSLTPSNVNPTQFGKLGEFQTDGLIAAQPVYVASVNINGSSRNIVIVVTEHDSVYALDADNVSGGPLWHRNYLDAGAGISTLPDNFGGRTTLAGEVGITGTPVVDPATGALYFVTTITRTGVAEQWLRAIDIKTGNDFGPGSAKIEASVAGDGRGSVNGQIGFDPSIQNQRAGLTKLGSSILVAWGSFSDWGVYHGWLMAFDAATLSRQAVFNPSTQYQASDSADGPADHGGGASFWQAGATPSIDSSGNIYLAAADGSFNADQGGSNYGDTVLKLRLSGGSFQVEDWFTPSNEACVNFADLEIGSGGVALLPTDATGGRKLAAVISKEGRLFLLNTDTMGHFNAGGNNQIPQEFMIGDHACSDGTGSSAAEGTGWNRLYGNVSYWNGNLYAQPSSMVLKQYRFSNGSLNPTAVAQAATISGLRGGNTVVSANGSQNAIVWAYDKSVSGRGVLHAYDATDVSHELWNSGMNPGRDQMGTGFGFAVPVVVNGRVIVTHDASVSVYGLLQ